MVEQGVRVAPALPKNRLLSGEVSMRRLDLKTIRASMLPFFLLLASAAFANSQLLPPEHEEIVLQVENMT